MPAWPASEKQRKKEEKTCDEFFWSKLAVGIA